MLDRDKIFLIFYINVDRINDTYEYINNVRNAFRFDNSVLSLFIPIKIGETRVECINPKYISDEEYVKVSEFVEDAQKKLDEFLNSFNNGTK